MNALTDEPLKESRAKRIRELMLSSALSGGVIGAGANALGRGATAISALKAGGVGATLGAGLAGASGLIGDAVLGDPEQGEQSAYTKRGGLGGAIAGGALGAVGGGLAASGGLGKLMRAAPKIKEFAASALGKDSVLFHPEENFLLKLFKDASDNPTAKKSIIGALGGAAAGAGIAGAHGADEGMQADFLTAQKKKLLTRKDREALA